MVSDGDAITGPSAGIPSRTRGGTGVAFRADLVIVTLIWAMVVIAYRLPLTALSYDDGNVLPERAAMRDNVDWLGHLLHFDQTRLTYVGDYALYRPGSHFLFWLGDVLARHDRMLLTLTTAVLYAATATALYLTLRRRCGFPLAFALCMIFVYPIKGTCWRPRGMSQDISWPW